MLYSHHIRAIQGSWGFIDLKIHEPFECFSSHKKYVRQADAYLKSGFKEFLTMVQR